MISGQELGRLAATAAAAPRSVAGSGPSQAVGGGADGVTLSPQSAEMGRWLAALHQLPDVRSEQVRRVSARLASGKAAGSREVARQMITRLASDRLAAQVKP